MLQLRRQQRSARPTCRLLTYSASCALHTKKDDIKGADHSKFNNKLNMKLHSGNSVPFLFENFLSAPKCKISKKICKSLILVYSQFKKKQDPKI